MSDHKPDSEKSTSEITGKALELTSQSTLSCWYELKSEQLIRKKSQHKQDAGKII